MDVLKASAFAVLAVGSTVVLVLVRGRPWGAAFFRRAVVTAVLVKIVACVLVYTLWPSLIHNSDAQNFYLPQTLALLSGQLPNRDFASSYSILFLPLLAIPVALWPSAGAVALTMIAAETGMLALYLRFRGTREGSGRWDVAFLYSWSPFSLYWVALSGHNGILIAAWTMAALILAQKRREWAAGAVGALAFLSTKLLAVLAWPAIVFYRRMGTIRRATPMVVSVLLAGCVVFLGMDFVSAMRHEMATATTGNVWSLLRWVSGGVGRAETPAYLPAVVFALAFTPMCIAYIRANAHGDRLDRGIAFVAAVNLLFLILSRKAFSYYLLMSLIFVMHSALSGGRRILVHLLALAFLGAVGSIEEIHTGDETSLLVLGALRIASYVYLLVVCFAASISDSGRAAGRTPAG